MAAVDDWKTANGRTRKRRTESPSVASSSTATLALSGTSSPSRTPIFGASKQLRGSPFNVLAMDEAAVSGTDAAVTPSRRRKRGAASTARENSIPPFSGRQSPMDSPKTAIKAGGKSIGSKSQLSGVRALLNFEELENVINIDRYNSLYEEFKTRYPKRPDIQLQAILEHTEQALANRDWRLTAFASKGFQLDRLWIDGKLNDFPKDCLNWLTDTLESYADSVLQSFFTTTVVGLLEEVKKAPANGDLRSSFGNQIVAQLLLRRLRARIDLQETMKTVRARFANFQANPAIAHTVLWLLTQNPVANDFPVWFDCFLPAFGNLATATAATVQSLSLDYGEILMNSSQLTDTQKVFIDPSQFEQLLITAHQSDGLIALHKRGGDYIPRLRRIYKFFKHALVNSEIRKSATATFHTSPADLFEILLPHASTADESVSQEILECLLLLLQVSPSTAADCFRLWLESYEANVAETLRLIKHIDFSQGKHKRAAGAVDQHQLAGFLRGILAINEKISTKTGWANSRAQKFGATKSMVSECTLLAQHTLRKSERGRSFWSQLLTVMLLLLMLVLTAIAVWSLVCRTEYFPDYRSSCKGTERFLKRIPFEQWRIKSQRFVAGNLQHLAQFQQWAIDQRPVLEAAIKAMLEFANDAFSILSEIAYDAYKRAQQALR